MKRPLFASTVGHEPLAFSTAEHESNWPHKGWGTEPRSLICTSRIFVVLFLMKHLNKYWSNLLSCHVWVHAHACTRTHTCTHNLSSQASGISLWRALWWLGRAMGYTVPGKGDWNQRGTWTCIWQRDASTQWMVAITFLLLFLKNIYKMLVPL